MSTGDHLLIITALLDQHTILILQRNGLSKCCRPISVFHLQRTSNKACGDAPMTHYLMTDQPLSLLLALSPLFHQWVALKPSPACLLFSFEARALRMLSFEPGARLLTRGTH